MSKSPVTTYRKDFSSRYELSREQQILEYLGQRQAPVPPVVMSHAEMVYLEMHHGGPDLKKWLSSSALTARDVAEALAQAIDALIKTARLNVWHLDVALRNFVVHEQPNSTRPSVWLIDFGNAICSHFTLQKPLWMRPHFNQHPLLQAALTKDWQQFFERHSLVQPSDWHTSFDIPTHLYQDDWTTNLEVEALPQKWCAVAHATGQMLISAALAQPSFLDRWLPKFHDLLNLKDEGLAQQKMVAVLHDLSHMPHESVDHDKTPRPRAQPSTAVVNPPPVYTPSEQAPMATTIVEKKQRLPHTFLSLRLLAIAALIGLGWWMLDIGYSTRGQALTPLTTSTVIVVLLSTLIGGVGCLVSAQKSRWIIRSMWAHVLGQALLIFELWIFGMDLRAVLILTVAPWVAVILLVLQRLSKQQP
jgi:hypothetical protein